jgi:hypothetical protein
MDPHRVRNAFEAGGTGSQASGDQVGSGGPGREVAAALGPGQSLPAFWSFLPTACSR